MRILVYVNVCRFAVNVYGLPAPRRWLDAPHSGVVYDDGLGGIRSPRASISAKSFARPLALLLTRYSSLPITKTDKKINVSRRARRTVIGQRIRADNHVFNALRVEQF